MPLIDIAPLQSDAAETAACLLAAAFAADPLHRAAYGAAVEARSEPFYRARLASPTGVWYAARRHEEILGVVHWRAGDEAGEGCGIVDVVAAAQLAWVDRVAATVFRWTAAGGLAAGVRAPDATGDDGDVSPVVLGPIAVRAAWRRRGIGGLLMARYCAALDARHDTGHLETAQPASVPFYERFGFSIVGEFDVLGVPCVAMQRMPEPPPGGGQSPEPRG